MIYSLTSFNYPFAILGKKILKELMQLQDIPKLLFNCLTEQGLKGSGPEVVQKDMMRSFQDH